jgi:hypothetical protein
MALRLNTTNQMVREFERVLGKSAAHVIKDHYGLKRVPTAGEIQAEYDNLKRRKAALSLDDKQERLAARLGVI